MSNVPRLRVFGVVLLAVALGGLTWQAWLLWSTQRAARRPPALASTRPAEPAARAKPAATDAPSSERAPTASESLVSSSTDRDAEAAESADSAGTGNTTETGMETEAETPTPSAALLATGTDAATDASGMPATSATSALTAESGVAPVADPAQLETLARLVGRVTLRGPATPVPGVQVRVTFSSTALVPAFTNEVTDAKGRFQFALSESARVLEISVRAGPDSCGVTRTLDLPLELGTETVQDLAVMRGGSIAGVVNGQDGLPIPHARVRSWNLAPFVVDLRDQAEPDQECIADGAGRFHLGGLGTICTLAADAPGLTGVARLEGQLANGRQVDGVSFELGPARELRGRVLQLGDRAVPQCAVRARPVSLAMREPVPGVSGIFRVPPATVKATSDEQGQFILRDLVSLPYEVTTESAQHQPWTGRHGPGDPALNIRLAAGTALTGVITAGGAPVADAQVSVCSLGGGAWPVPLRETSTDAQGRFEFLGLKPDPDGLLQVRAAGHALHVVQPLEIAVDAPHELQIELAEARVLAGVVVDEHDQPLAGRRVSIQGDRVLPLAEGLTTSRVPTWESLFPEGGEQVTDAQGAFRFELLYDGQFELRVAEATGPGTAAALAARSGDEHLRLRIGGSSSAGVTLAGTVRDAKTGKPVEDFRITPLIPTAAGGMSGEAQAFTAPDGSFRLTGLAPGPIEPRVQAPGYCDLRVPQKTYAAGEHRLDLRLTVSRSLALRVVDSAGRPLPDASLGFVGEDGRTLTVKSGERTDATQVETDAAGEAVVTNLPAARVTVHARKGLRGDGQDFRFDLSEELRGTQELVLGDEAQSTLTVLVLGAPESGSTSGSAAAGLDAMLPDLQSQARAGSVWPILSPITIRVLAANGRVLAQQRLDPREPSAEATPLPGVPGAFSLAVSVPAEPLEIEAAAAGYESARGPWQPDRANEGAEVVLLVLRKT